MFKNTLLKYSNTFTEILFLRFYSHKTKEFNIFNQFLLYSTSIILFYIPIMYSAITLSMNNYEYIPYLILIIALHVISKFIRVNSQRVQQRFTAVRAEKVFILRVILVIEYVVFMWIVYLLYPISCILFPLSMLLLFYENLFGFNFFINLLTLHMEQFILYGSLISYAVFIFFDSYKRLLKGSLPSYLSLYAILTAISGFIDGVIQMYMPNNIQGHMIMLSSMLSSVFSLSNHSLKIVSSTVMFVSAVCSLYATCGLDRKTLRKLKADFEAQEELDKGVSDKTDLPNTP